MKRIVFEAAALAILATAIGAHAQPFKCTVNGKVVYQQVPCEGGQSVDTSGAGKADLSSQGAVQARADVARYKWLERVELAISRGQVITGMTRGEVQRSWGNPNKINKTVDAGGVSEQWVYRSAKVGYDQYVYLENGVVRSMQSAE